MRRMARLIIFCVTFVLVATAAYAQDAKSVSTKTSSTQKIAPKKEKKKYRPDDFGNLHDGAKARGVDTSNPESLKGRDIGADIAKSIRL